MDIDRIYESLDKIDSELTELRIISAKQEENIKEHIRRTELAEENLTILRQEIEPLKQHVIVINGILRVIGVVSVIIGSAAGIFEIISKIINYMK
jgi:hypothetical protein